MALQGYLIKLLSKWPKLGNFLETVVGRLQQFRAKFTYSYLLDISE